MEVAILSLHSIVRWLILLFGIWAIVRSIGGLGGKKAYLGLDNKISLFFMICADIQLLLGLYLFFYRPWFQALKDSPMKDIMKDKVSRFVIFEHALLMIIAWLLIHIGRSMVKRTGSDAAKHKKTLLWFGIALLLILISIPWPFRETIGKEWIRFFSN